MAQIKYSALVQEMRNKLNGSVMSKNRYGNYVRNKTTPVNPQTEYQQNQRSRLSSVSQSWQGLTSAQRQSFADLAAVHPFTNIFGDQVKYDGKAMYSKLNLNLLSAGQPMISSAVPFGETPFVAITSATVEDDGSVSLSVSEATIPAGYTAILHATEPLPATINFVKNRFRELGTVTATTSTINAKTVYDARFRPVTSADVGKAISFRLFLVDNATGQSSIASEGRAIVAAA